MQINVDMRDFFLHPKVCVCVGGGGGRISDEYPTAKGEGGHVSPVSHQMTPMKKSIFLITKAGREY